MRRSRCLASTLAVGCLLSSLFAAQAMAAKKAGYAECASLLDPFRGKASAVVKDEAVSEYAPLIRTYWKKGCPASLYEEQVSDAALRQRIEAVAPRPAAKSEAKSGKKAAKPAS